MMKLIRDIYIAMQTARQFWRQQHATLAMLNGTYVRQPAHDEMVVLGTETILSITQYGNLYQVTRTDYVANEPERVQTWLTTYGYISMQLADIGLDSYFVFDTVSKSLYLATINENGDTIIELFTKNM